VVAPKPLAEHGCTRLSSCNGTGPACARRRLAALCRRSWKRSGGSPAATTS